MIDHEHQLSISRQAKLLGISRGSVYYQRRPSSPAEGIIFQSQTAYKQLRKMMVEEYLVGVISLPSGVFQPYTGVKTSILVLDKIIAKRNPNILFSEVKDIGFSLGIRRIPTKENDLPYVQSDYRAYYKGQNCSPKSWLVSREKILANECNLSGTQYRSTLAISNQRMVKVGNVCIMTKGAFSSTKTPPGQFPLILTAAEPKTSAEYQFDQPAVCVPLISSTGHGKATLHRIHFGSGRFALANLLVALQPAKDDDLDVRFLYYVLDAKRNKIAGLMRGAANVGMKPADLAQFQFPLPPLDVQKDIVAEVEGYQKVIGGARAVIDNYRPHIPIDPAWPMVPIGKLAQNLDSLRIPIDKASRKEGPFPYYGASGIVDYVDNYIFDGNILLISEDGANLISRSTPIAFSVSGKCWVNNHAHVLKFKSLATQKLVEVYLNSISIEDFVTGSAQPKLNQKALNSIPIPMPNDIDTQHQIVGDLEAEQALVASNRKLIELMEGKIRSAIARVWGD